MRYRSFITQHWLGHCPPYSSIHLKVFRGEAKPEPAGEDICHPDRDVLAVSLRGSGPEQADTL